ncbi:hypothetical protein C8J57DRAFT_1235769 [Mycena rebaudengoi]|nr:hypothetical protein C8J57DRAFT_1235769 [Mycena rebaudengoi]
MSSPKLCPSPTLSTVYAGNGVLQLPAGRSPIRREAYHPRTPTRSPKKFVPSSRPEDDGELLQDTDTEHKVKHRLIRRVPDFRLVPFGLGPNHSPRRCPLVRRAGPGPTRLRMKMACSKARELLKKIGARDVVTERMRLELYKLRRHISLLGHERKLEKSCLN